MNKTLSYLLLSVLILDIVNGQFFFRAKLRERKKNKDDFDVQSTATSANRNKTILYIISLIKYLYSYLSPYTLFKNEAFL